MPSLASSAQIPLSDIITGHAIDSPVPAYLYDIHWTKLKLLLNLQPRAAYPYTNSELACKEII